MVGHRMSFTPVAQLSLAMSQCCLCMQPLTKQAAIASRPCSGGARFLVEERPSCTGLAACQWPLAVPSSGLPPTLCTCGP